MRVSLTEDEFLDIEEGILSTAKGRAFLAEYRGRHSSMSVDRFQKIINEKLDAFQQKLEPVINRPSEAEIHTDVMRREIFELHTSIVEVRKNVAALKPKDSSNSRILTATEELDAIIEATENATSEILTAAEIITGVLPKVKKRFPEEAQIIEDKTMEILMSCGFQDITGQRISKVVNALKYIEQRINSMISIWGITESGPVVLETAKFDDTRPDAHLLNGPQLNGAGRSQDDIDALFGEMPATPGTVPTFNALSALDDVTDEDLKNCVIPVPKITLRPVGSQEDIDAMFGSSPPANSPRPTGEKVSQNDIDALFD